jgi:hypothetical protein
MLSQNMEPVNDYNLPDTLPFFYHLETGEGIIKWTCSYGPEGEVMSVYEFNSADAGRAREFHEDKLEGLAEGIEMREKLVSEGWEPTEIPKVKFNKDEDQLNRKQRRHLAKLIVSGKAKDLRAPEPDKKPAPQKPPEWHYSDEESDS